MVNNYWLVVSTPLKHSPWEGLHPIDEMENKTCLKPPTRWNLIETKVSDLWCYLILNINCRKCERLGVFPKITDVKRPMDTPVRLVNGTHAAGSLLCTHSTVTDPCETLAFFYDGPCFKIYLALTCIIPSFICFYDDPCIIPSFSHQAFLSSEIDRFRDIFDFPCLAAPSLQKKGSIPSPPHNWV